MDRKICFKGLYSYSSGKFCPLRMQSQFDSTVYNFKYNHGQFKVINWSQISFLFPIHIQSSSQRAPISQTIVKCDCN